MPHGLNCYVEAWRCFIIFLAFANQADPQVQLVQKALEERGHKLLHLDMYNYPDQIGIHIEFPKDKEPLLSIKTSEGIIPAKELSAVWVRRYNSAVSKASSYDDMARMFATGESQMMVDGLMHVWPESVPWVSKPNLINRACNKPYNLMVAQQVGFKIPQTVFSNESDQSTTFLENLNPVAMKTLATLWIQSPSQKEASRGKEEQQATIFFTKKYQSEDLIERIDGLPSCPVIFQEYIPKALELRVNVIGKKVLTCAIYSQEHADNIEDYRVHWTDNLRLEPYALPDEIDQLCIRLVEKLGLDMGCIDLILTPAGEYVYLEINPVGQWIWLQERVGMPIAETIADLLITKSTKNKR